MADSSSILIIGAGELGTAVLEALARHPERRGAQLAVLLRPSTIESQDPVKKTQHEHLRSLGAALVAADIAHDAVDDLAMVFGRYHTVIACSGFGLPPGTQVKITKAVLQAGVPRYFPWQWGIDYDIVGQGSAQDLFDEQLRVRALLRGQRGTDWVIVSTGVFMSFLFQPAFGVVDLPRRTLRALGAWDAEVSVTEVRDIGAVAAQLAYESPGEEVRSQVVYVAGDTLSYARLADLVQERFGGEWRRELWDEEVLRGRLEQNPADGMAKYASVWAKGEGVAWDKRDTLNERRGIEMMSVERYLRELPDLR
ncbi:hypothetical protein AAE478_002773 [Parahypoxylon ruwenzoriense]